MATFTSSGHYTVNQAQLGILSTLSMLHYYATISLVYELKDFTDTHRYYLYETSLIIVVLCMLTLIRMSIVLTARTSYIAFITVVLCPIVSIFIHIDSTDLYNAHCFQVFMIFANACFHLSVLCMNGMNAWVTFLCFISVLDGLTFISVAVFLMAMSWHQRNKLLPFHLLLETVLSLLSIAIVATSTRTQSLLRLSQIAILNHFILNLPFMKSYLVWHLMYAPAKEDNFNFIITHARNHAPTITHRLYAFIHCMSHDMRWQWRSNNERTQLLTPNKCRPKCIKLGHHDMDELICWKTQNQFMCLHEPEKLRLIQQFSNKTDANSNRTRSRFKCHGRAVVLCVYAVSSVFAYLYPVLWLILGRALAVSDARFLGLMIQTECQWFAIWFLLAVYFLCAMGTICGTLKNKWFVYRAMTDYRNINGRYGIRVSTTELVTCSVRMQQVEVIMKLFPQDVARLVLLYCYKQRLQSPIYTEHSQGSSIDRESKNESVSLYHTNLTIYTSCNDTELPRFLI